MAKKKIRVKDMSPEAQRARRHLQRADRALRKFQEIDPSTLDQNEKELVLDQLAEIEHLRRTTTSLVNRERIRARIIRDSGEVEALDRLPQVDDHLERLDAHVEAVKKRQEDPNAR